MAFSLVDHGPTLFPNLYPLENQTPEAYEKRWKELKKEVHHCLQPLVLQVFDIYQKVFLK